MKQIHYPFSSRNIVTMEATENLFKFGWACCPASLIAMSWTRTRSMTVVLISSGITALVVGLSLPLPPTSTPFDTHSLSSSIAGLNCWNHNWTHTCHLHLTWFISCLTNGFSTWLIGHVCGHFWAVVCEWRQQCVSCVLLRWPVSAILPQGAPYGIMCFVNENVFRVL